MVGRQYGGYVQSGNGGFPVFRGSRMQRGYGIGSVLSGLFRAAVPFLRKGAKSLGKEALRTGINVGQDVLNGQNLKKAVRSRAGQSVKKMIRNSEQTPVSRSKPRKAPGRRAKKGLKGKTRGKSVISSRTEKAKRSLDIFDR